MNKEDSTLFLQCITFFVLQGKVQGLLGKKSAGVNEVFAHEDIGDDDL